jgi:hypothetical protein
MMSPEEPMLSLIDVLARWAYSEILDARSSPYYNNLPGVAELRAKRRTGVPFKALPSSDRHQLASNCACVRGGLWMFLTDVEHFREERLTKSQIAPFLVPSNVSGLPMMRFDDFMDTPSSGPDDPRSEAAAYTKVPDDPLTLGRSGDDYVLLDGYHRAASFWRSAPHDVFILGYMPFTPPRTERQPRLG